MYFNKVIFIDNTPHNVKVAEKLGVHGLLLGSAQTLEAKLNEPVIFTDIKNNNTYTT